MGPDEAIAAAHADARLKIASALAYLRMSVLDPDRMPPGEACEKALEQLEDVPQVAVLLREVEVEKPHISLEVPPRADAKHGLSAREIQILQLVSRGMTNEEVGQHLHLAPNTIKSHMSRILRRLNVKTRAAAVTVATKRGIEL